MNGEGGNGKAVMEGAAAELAECIRKTADKCAQDRDTAPHCIVIKRTEIGAAGRIWQTVPIGEQVVLMDIEPDQRDRKQAVLLFRRKEETTG